jgi:two-component system response regulator YesN
MKMLQEQFRAADETVSICVGKPMDDLCAVHCSYQDALSLEKLTYMYGLDTILDDSADYGYSGTEFFDCFNFDRLLKKIKTMQKGDVAEELDVIFDTLSKCSYDFARLIINTLFFHIMETGTQILKSFGDSELPFNLDAVFVGLEQQQTLADVKTYICRFCYTMLDTINESHSNSRYQLFQKIASIIDSELSDSSLSLTYLSSKLSFSPGYIGKVFSAYSEYGIPEYINLKRVEKAKQLLQDTVMTIEEVASSVGFQSSAYFITIFKKSFGITPNGYRKSLTR